MRSIMRSIWMLVSDVAVVSIPPLYIALRSGNKLEV
jgi:hypothetical protein